MTRDQDLKLVEDHTKNKNLVRHMLAVESVMRTLAEKFGGDPDVWGLAGLLHDADYEEFGETAHKDHTHKTIEWLADYNVPEEVINVIKAHAWNYVDGAPKPQNNFEWSLYTCDELTGLIVAVALVKGGKLADVEVNSVLKKWNQKSFAAGANRNQIAMCEEKLNIPLEEFIGITLSAMQKISSELGL